MGIIARSIQSAILGPSGGVQAYIASAAPFNPADITGLQLFLQYDAAHCTSNTPEQPVSAVSASYGTTRTASAAGTERPTFQSDGLQYDGSANQVMSLSSPVELTGALTLYSVFNVPTGADIFPLGDGGIAVVGYSGGSVVVFDNTGSGPSLSALSGLSLIRFSVDADGTYSLKATGGQSVAAGGSPPNYTFGVLGASVGNMAFSGSTDNRSLCDIIKTGDNSGTQENTDILQWIFDTYGATLA